jgi:hypothetical protein
MSAQHRVAAFTSWANTPDRNARTAPARRAARERFEKQVDPEGRLSPEARTKAAEAAYRAHMIRLSIKAAESRRRKAAAKGKGRAA